MKGEQIAVTILLRNVNETNLQYFGWFSPWEFPFNVIGPDNKNVPEIRPVETPWLGPKTLPVYPRTQKRFGIRIDDRFDFAIPGEYSVSVKTRVLKLEGGGLSEIQSERAHFKLITAKPETDTNSPPDHPKK